MVTSPPSASVRLASLRHPTPRSKPAPLLRGEAAASLRCRHYVLRSANVQHIWAVDEHVLQHGAVGGRPARVLAESGLRHQHGRQPVRGDLPGICPAGTQTGMLCTLRIHTKAPYKTCFTVQKYKGWRLTR
jgi:hypothetical protein